MGSKLRVACYNQDSKDPKMIFSKIEKIQADLILFPEGFFEKNAIDDALWLKKSLQLKMVFVLGYSSENYITQKIFLPTNKILKYHKIHLGTVEKQNYLSGDEILTFEYANFKIGVMICSDTHFNELFIIQRKLGTELILAPFRSPHNKVKRKKLWDKFLPTRAYDYRLSIVANNYYSEGLEGSVAYNPYGDEIKSNKESFLPMYVIEKFESKGGMGTIDFFKKRREEVYVKIFKSISKVGNVLL